MEFLTPDTPAGVLIAFAACAVVIVLAGVRLSGVADRLADRTGLGEAVVGAVMLGAVTSLSGLTTSVTAAWNGLPELAVSNAAGGIAGQTFFLAVADLAYRRANLEHAAASLENLIQSTVLAGCLALAILGAAAPGYALGPVHPVSPLLVGFYLLGLRVTRRARANAAWRPVRTDETRIDDLETDESGGASTARLWAEFAALGAVTAAAGFVIGRAGEGALTLAVGGIIGGNAFDVLFLAASDAAYTRGSIYAAIDDRQVFLIALSLLMTTVLAMGLLRREKHGFARVGFETVLLIAIYLGGSAALIAMG